VPGNRQVESLPDQPQHGLSNGPQLEEFPVGQLNGFLYPQIGILLQALIDRLDVSDRRRHDQFATRRLLAAGFLGPLSQQVELVFVETPFEPKQQAIIAVPRIVHHLLIQQQRVHHSAHLDQLLPIPTVAGKAGYLSRCHHSHLT
jgi:hypothetical protein